MSSDNVGHTVSMIAAMLLQLVLSENRACHSLRANERILRASTYSRVTCNNRHISFGLAYISFAVAYASCGRVHIGNLIWHYEILINHAPPVAYASQTPTVLLLVSCQCRVTHPWTLNPTAAKYYRPI